MAIPKSYRVNHVVGIGLICVKNLTEVPVFWLNCICWGSDFQPVMRRGENQETGANNWKCFVEIRFLGHPEILFVNSGTDFQGDFAETCGANGITLLPIDPKHLGRTDAHNGQGMNGDDNSNMPSAKEFPQWIPNS